MDGGWTGFDDAADCEAFKRLCGGGGDDDDDDAAAPAGEPAAAHGAVLEAPSPTRAAPIPPSVAVEDFLLFRASILEAISFNPSTCMAHSKTSFDRDPCNTACFVEKGADGHCTSKWTAHFVAWNMDDPFDLPQ